MFTRLLLIGPLLSMQLQVAPTSCVTDPVKAERVAKLSAESSAENVLGDAIKRGLRGDGIHFSWMDSMKRHNIPRADFEIRFSWENGTVGTLEIVSDEYFREYARIEAQIKDPQILERLRSDGFRREMREAALDRARQLLMRDDLSKARFKRAYGTYYLTLLDDECLPNISAPAQICDGDETPLMRRILRGESNAEMYGVEAPDCKDPRHPDADRLDPKDLIASGVDVNARDHLGITALMLAAGMGSSKFVRILLDAGAHVNERDQLEGSTALVRAVRVGAIEVVELLIARGADVDARDDCGETALMEAVRKGHADVARSLLELGANPNIKSNRGETALSLAFALGRPELVQLLKNRGAKN